MKSKTLSIVEFALSTNNYHLSETGDNGKPALCGLTSVMSTRLPLSTWNTPPDHIRSKYCRTCSATAKMLGYGINSATQNTITFK